MGGFLFFPLMLSAQESMKEVFKTMPDSIVPYLTENNRLDFIDFLESDMKAEVRNTLGGTSEMTQLTADGLALRVSEAMQLSMRLLPVAEAVDSASQVVCVITSYGTPASESQIALYSLQWRPLPVDCYFVLPSTPYTAQFSDAAPTAILLRMSNAFDPLAMEDQTEPIETLKTVQWTGKRVK